MKYTAPKTLSLAHGTLAVAALAVTPLFFCPGAVEAFVSPKIAWGLSIAILLLLFAVVRATLTQTVRIELNGINICLGFFFLWHLLLWPLAASPSLAADRIAWIAGVLILAWGWQEWAGGNRRRIILMLWWLIAASAIIAVWTLYQDICKKWADTLPAWLPRASLGSDMLGDWRGFLTATMGNTDFIAAWLATLYLPTLILFFFVRRRLQITLLFLALLLSTAALIVCWSVGGNGALILASIIFLVGIGKKQRQYLWHKKRHRTLTWATGCLLIILIFVTNTPLNPHQPGIFQEAFASERWEEGGPTRGVIWLNTFEMIRTHQLTGVGPGSFTFVYPTMFSSFTPNTKEWMQYQGLWTNAAHNTLLQTWAELGPLGVLLLLLMVIGAFRSLRHVAKRSKEKRLNTWIAWGGIAAFATLCADSMMTFPLLLPAHTIFFFCLLSLGPMLEKTMLEVNTFQMPPITLQGRWSEITLHLKGMKRVKAISGSLDLPTPARAVVILFALCLTAGALWMVWRPVRADLVYRQAREKILLAHMYRANNAIPQAITLEKEAEPHLIRALEICPRHQDCRSAYTQLLLDHKRYAECIEQLDIVMKRLDSTELYWRRAVANKGLGNEADAQRDNAIVMKRMPPAPPQEKE